MFQYFCLEMVFVCHYRRQTIFGILPPRQRTKKLLIKTLWPQNQQAEPSERQASGLADAVCEGASGYPSAVLVNFP
jgi:hypothetical protein